MNIIFRGRTPNSEKRAQSGHPTTPPATITSKLGEMLSGNYKPRCFIEKMKNIFNFKIKIF